VGERSRTKTTACRRRRLAPLYSLRNLSTPTAPSCKTGPTEKAVSIYQDIAFDCSGCAMDSRGGWAEKPMSIYQDIPLNSSISWSNSRRMVRQKKVCLFIKTSPLIAQDGRGESAVLARGEDGGTGSAAMTTHNFNLDRLIVPLGPESERETPRTTHRMCVQTAKFRPRTPIHGVFA